MSIGWWIGADIIMVINLVIAVIMYRGEEE
jgi:hypothetical protein